jgi:hypothetical protein
MEVHKGFFLKLLYYLVCPLLLLSYLLEPFTEDVRIYLGVAKVTALTPGFPQNFDLIWDSRFVGHRILFYLLDLITPFNGWLYSIWMKFVVAIATIVILFYFSKRVSEKMQVPFHYPFIFGFLGFFAINNFVIFTSEYFSVIIAMLMMTLLLDDKRNLWHLSGLLGLPLILLKGLPVLLVGIVALATIMLVKDYKDRLYTALTTLPLIILSLLAVLWIFPHTITDGVMLFRVAHITRLGILPSIQYFFKYGIGVIGFIPLVIIGVVSLFLVVSTFEDDDESGFGKHVRDLGLLVAMWGLAAVYVFFIAEFFYLHYFVMLIPAILTVCYFLKLSKYRDPAFAILALVILLIFALVVSGWAAGLSFKGYSYWSERQSMADEILMSNDILSQPSTLYLDQGSAAYYFTTPSACRFVAALPYQRDMPNWDMKMLPQYWEMRNCSLDYTGKYVIVDPIWFNLSVSTHSEIADKLSTEYVKVYSSFWDVYRKG